MIKRVSEAAFLEEWDRRDVEERYQTIEKILKLP